MLEAVIKGKAIKSFFDEDCLTSTVFGILKYLPYIYLRNVLSDAVNIERKRLGEELTIPDGAPEFEFWPNYDPEGALIGKDVDVHVTCKSFADTGSCEGQSCVCEMAPLEGLTVEWRYWVQGEYHDLPDNKTDENGVATQTITVEDYTADNVLHVKAKPKDFNEETAASIHGVYESEITMGMWRYIENQNYPWVPLEDGGTFSYKDTAVMVRVYNPTSYYLELEILELPHEGGDMLKPTGIPWSDHNDLNRIVVFPGTTDYMFYMEEDPAVGEVHFFLIDHNSNDTLPDHKMAILSTCCESGDCPDCYSHRWYGLMASAGVGFKLYSIFGAYGSGAISVLHCLDRPSTEIPVLALCGGGGIIGGGLGGIGGGIYCSGYACKEDLLNTSFSVSGGGTLTPKGGIGIGIGKCSYVGYGSGAKAWLAIGQACNLYKLPELP